MEELPNWAEKILPRAGTEKIEAAIASAEAKTSGEIVPMLVRRCSTVGHVPLLAFCLLVILVFAFDLPGYQVAWGASHIIWLVIDWFLAALFTLGLARLDWVQRLLTPKLDQLRQVDLRAQVEFYSLGLDKTAGRTGVLLFVSLMEHRAVVLADKAIAEKLDQKIWTEVVDLMLEGVQQRDLSAGLCKAIARCGELLAQHFPIQADDLNELRNRLVVRE